MTSTEEKLKERIKELTCLYEVTSIVANANYNDIESSLESIAFCVKKAWRYPEDTSVEIKTGDYQVKTELFSSSSVFQQMPIKVFNKVEGAITVFYPSELYTLADFLPEEALLLQNIGIEIGNVLERKQIKENEQKIQRQIERNDRLSILGEITAGIAHELNTPLANILGYSELLKNRIQNEPALISDLDKIINSAIFSREVVKKLMFFACEMPQQKDEVNIVPVIEEAIELLKPVFAKKEIRHQFDHNNDRIYLKVDTIQLTQVIFNLVLNAIYFSPKQGFIKITLEDYPENIQLGISDEGPGIIADAEKIFDPFYTTKPVGEGSGLGLSVVHGIIKSHQGSITYRKNHPKGTIFVVDFPKSNS
ncbi:sensor histidine kinase [Zhouia amylolytica]|uniref:histidine kinase n=1 Tax=Zhouia amylolytica AD3 TaxID=1286632 RepID=W2USM8_9FLAO|nr:HAMP domain-containing sensor histidine kinase [Zhouia amylolytica]ETN96481.1 histidine kinase [Zhouia amylolytica AD3]